MHKAGKAYLTPNESQIAGQELKLHTDQQSHIQ